MTTISKIQNLSPAARRLLNDKVRFGTRYNGQASTTEAKIELQSAGLAQITYGSSFDTDTIILTDRCKSAMEMLSS